MICISFTIQALDLFTDDIFWFGLLFSRNTHRIISYVSLVLRLFVRSCPLLFGMYLSLFYINIAFPSIGYMAELVAFITDEHLYVSSIFHAIRSISQIIQVILVFNVTLNDFKMIRKIVRIEKEANLIIGIQLVVVMEYAWKSITN